jgi:hypothetical protein
LKAKRQEDGAPAVGKETKVANADEAVVTENSVRAGNAKILSACRHSLPEKLIEGTIQ